MKQRTVTVAALSILLCSITGCATKPLPTMTYPKTIYPASRYPFSSESNGLSVAAVPFTPERNMYADPGQPPDKQTGLALNVAEAGVLPVRLIIRNQTKSEILIDPDQIVGMSGPVAYRAYAPQEAADLVIQSDVFRNALKGSRVGPVVKSIVGGEFLLDAAKSGVGGAASGGMTGGTTGAAKGAASVTLERAGSYEKALTQLIIQEYTGQAIKRQTLYPGFTADGLIFLPSRIGIEALLLHTYGLKTHEVIQLRIGIK
jgi:hypothetical protein